MKKTLSLFLLLMMLVTAFASCKSNSTTDPASGSTPAGSTGSPGTSDFSSGNDEDDGGTPDSIFSTLEPNTANVKKTHTPLKDLPSFATLVGSDTLPPIDNQGGLGCCASNAITYMQFTNAVAQFKKHNGGLGSWSPSTDYMQCFSPKFTYQYAGASTSNVYSVLIDHGALKNGTDSFAKDNSGGSQSVIGGKPQQQTLRWVVSEGAGEEALQYRLLDFEQTFVTNNPLYTAPGKSGVAMTTSEAGQEMILKIKEAIASGNVVVTGGYPNTWQSERLGTASGTLGKSGDHVITFATDDKNGGHQVCIVAYDDDLQITTNGITMKGAFLIANSWGTGWGNKGYMWIMYDALNSESEKDGFKLPVTLSSKGLKRDWALDQFCFVYWDSDITDVKPELYAEVELSVTNRDSFTMELGRTDALGRTETITPHMFSFMDMHEKYDQTGGYLNPDGILNGQEVNGFYTVSFGRLYSVMPKGVTYRDFDWSLKISSSSENSPVTVKSITLKSSDGQTVAELSFGEGEVLTRSNCTYVFGFGKQPSRNFTVGEFTLENAASGKYLAMNGVMELKLDTENNAAVFVIELDVENNRYILNRNDKKYVLDAVNGLKSGEVPRFNISKPTERYEFQNWKFSYNEDGTISVYLTTEKGTNYALGEKDGSFCLIKATEMTDSIKWKAHPTNAASTSVSVAVKDSKFTVSGTVKSGVSSVKLVVTDTSGAVLAEKETSVSNRAFSDTIETAGTGTRIVKVLNAADGTPAGNFYVLVG